MTKPNPYLATGMFRLITCDSRDKWLEERKKGIGGSDASCLLNKNPWKTLRELWNEKKRESAHDEISNPNIVYGTNAEEHLRALYGLKHLDEEIYYIPDVILESVEHPWMRYSPDGLIYEPKTGRYGILEIKTSMISSSAMHKKWSNNSVPENYYIQTLHGLLVTGFDFVAITAELRYKNGDASIVERRFTREEVIDELDYLTQNEKEAWDTYFEGDKEPPIFLEI